MDGLGASLCARCWMTTAWPVVGCTRTEALMGEKLQRTVELNQILGSHFLTYHCSRPGPDELGGSDHWLTS